MRAPESVSTQRLRLRRPRRSDAAAIFERYASDPEVTRFLAWPAHRGVEHSLAFVRFSDDTWDRTGAGPYLLELAGGSPLLGGTGLQVGDEGVAETGYVLAREAWGRGYATEALRAMIEVGRELDLRVLTACVHPQNHASIRVLQKCGFVRTSSCAQHLLPNLDAERTTAVYEYRLALRSP